MTTVSAETKTIAAARKKLFGRRAKLARLESDTENDRQELDAERHRDERGANAELTLVLERLSEREQRELVEIDAALTRIDEGKWGLCEKCSKKIARPRLAAMPEARLCLTCAA